MIVALYMMFFTLRAGGIEAYVLLGWGQVLVDVIEAVSLAILIIVCAVPEGLPLMISIVLMQNTSRMLSRGVLVRRAVGIETAGALNILFSDKTGTITGGRLSVVEFFYGGWVGLWCRSPRGRDGARGAAAACHRPEHRLHVR